MSDASDSPTRATSSSADPPSQPKPEKKGGGPLRIILIILLIFMVIAFAYDRYIRGVVKNNFAKVESLVDATLHEEKSPPDIHQLLGREPDHKDDFGHYSIETYNWRRGIFVWNYFVKVVYRHEDDKVILYNVTMNVDPSANDLPREPRSIPADDTDTDDMGNPPMKEVPPDDPLDDVPQDDVPQDDVPQDDAPQDDAPQDDGADGVEDPQV